MSLPDHRSEPSPRVPAPPGTGTPALTCRDLIGLLLDYLEGKLAVQRKDPAAARAALARALAGSLPDPVAAEARAMLDSLPP